MKEQQRNRRDNRVLLFNGRSACLAEWEEVTGIKQETLSMRLRRGWTTKQTLTTEVRP